MDSIMLTLTYNEASTPCGPLRRQFDKTVRLVRRQINRVSDDFLIYPEYTRQGIIHYHIIFSCIHADAQLYYYTNLMDCFRKKGYIYSKVINNMAGAVEYCSKIKIEMENVLSISLPVSKDTLIDLNRPDTCITKLNLTGF